MLRFNTESVARPVLASWYLPTMDYHTTTGEEGDNNIIKIQSENQIPEKPIQKY